MFIWADDMTDDAFWSQFVTKKNDLIEIRKNDSVQTAKDLIKKTNYSMISMYEIFFCANMCNSRKIIDYFIINKEFIGTEQNRICLFNQGLEGASLGGHFELVELMISHGATNLNHALNKACINGSKDIIELLISK